MSDHAATLRAVLRPPIVVRSLWVALIVGTTLNVINQGDRLATGVPLDGVKLGLTFVVPFLVVSFGAWSALAAKQPD